MRLFFPSFPLLFLTLILRRLQRKGKEKSCASIQLYRFPQGPREIFEGKGRRKGDRDFEGKGDLLPDGGVQSSAGGVSTAATATNQFCGRSTNLEYLQQLQLLHRPRG